MNKTIRNLVIFSLFTVGGGWLGIWLNQVTENTQPPMQSLGVLIWLMSPALAGFLLRALGGAQHGLDQGGRADHRRAGVVRHGGGSDRFGGRRVPHRPACDQGL